MKNKECTTGPSFCQICGKEMPFSQICIQCNKKSKRNRKNKPKNK